MVLCSLASDSGCMNLESLYLYKVLVRNFFSIVYFEPIISPPSLTIATSLGAQDKWKTILVAVYELDSHQRNWDDAVSM